MVELFNASYDDDPCPGIDNSVATHGGVVAYRAGSMEPLQVATGEGGGI